MICQPPLTPSPARITATMMSGHAAPVPNTPSAAATTAILPIASLREQIHTERRLASPSRWRHRLSAQAKLATSASTPITPIVSALGSVPAPILKIEIGGDDLAARMGPRGTHPEVN